jgi:hypothetical protein
MIYPKKLPKSIRLWARVAESNKNKNREKDPE